MPYKFRRNCPFPHCGKRDLLYLSDHLRQVHGLSSEERQPWLKRASHLPPPVDLPVEQYPVNLPPSSCPVIAIPDNNRVLSPVHGLETQPHPDFVFQHPYSMMVVGPSQCGKTHFVHQLLTHKRIAYPDKKPMRVCWYYNQWQPKYDEIQRDLQSRIRFVQGLPELEENLSNINNSKHTIIVLDDLMAEAKDSPVVSKLFTQGRHRNASVILLLQNMFPKGKYNTDISRNATYKVLFRSPGDCKQIDIMAEQTFAKDRPRFMQAYNRETDRPYGYIMVDNHPRTVSEHQVVGNVFGDCYTYPHITTSPSSHVRESQPAITRKRQAPEIKASKKCKVWKVERSTKKKKKRMTKKSVYDSSEEDETSEEEEGLTKEEKKRLLEENWIRWSEAEDDEESPSEGEEQGVDLSDDEGPPGESYYERLNRLAAPSDSPPEEQQDTLEPDWVNPGEEENHYGGKWHYPGFTYRYPRYPPRGSGGRTVYE